MTNFLKVVDDRIRANPAGLVIYEHEVKRFVDALRDIASVRISVAKGAPNREALNADSLEESIRTGFFRFRGLPVRVANPQ